MSNKTWYRKLLHVLQDRIDEAIRRSSPNCMVSETIADELPVIRVITDSATIRMTHKASGMRYIFLTPQRVLEYIADWDEARPILPFDFRLGNPIQITKVKTRTRIKSDTKPLDVTKASEREVKDAIRKGSDITGQRVINHSPAHQDRAPIVVGGDTPALRTIFGPKRRYGFRGLARRYGDMEAKARAEGKAEALAEAAAKVRKVKVRKRARR